MTFKDHCVDWLTTGRDDQYSVVRQFNRRIATERYTDRDGVGTRAAIHESAGRALVQRR